ncbi:DGQHR domain-containing protein DpdB [Nonomuraea sp. NPDC049758]|uniref:DGQHR domain-containing protein DpdB n=1 Tax=Nonomuraea sp. NPDC049758 TaxID=3154360 RepID=UPI00342750D4
MATRRMLRLPALEVRQGSRRIYCFAVDGKKLHEFAAVSRIRRDDDAQLQGYQRPEVASHIKAIQRYLESDGAILANAVVLAFNSKVHFESSNGREVVTYSTPGELLIPVVDGSPDSEKPAWLVDGQQRSAALREADVQEFPIPAVAFIADDESEQRAQFILVNNTKPLPKGLIHELLPETQAHLPPAYARKQLPAVIMTRLNGTFKGPFYRSIATPTSPDGYIKDNSVLKMIENSIYEGALYKYRNPHDGTGDVDRMLQHLNTYWSLVRDAFPEAWALPPRLSRLTHGAGIQAMGYLMDRLTQHLQPDEMVPVVNDALKRIEPGSAWTGRSWNLGDGNPRRWDSIQNTPNDVRWLSRGLLYLVQQESLFLHADDSGYGEV